MQNSLQIEPQVRSVLSEPVGGEPRAVESQLSKAKTLHNEILSQGRLIDNTKDVSAIIFLFQIIRCRLESHPVQ